MVAPKPVGMPTPNAQRPNNDPADSHSPNACPQNDYPLGRWSLAGFQFNRPEAERRWHGDAFDQGVHHENWHLGRNLSPGEAQLVEIGVPKQHDHYLGPDGALYQINPAAREDAAVAALRKTYIEEEPTFERGQSLL